MRFYTKSLNWFLFPGYLLLIFVSTGFMLWYSLDMLRQSHIDKIREDLFIKAEAVAEIVNQKEFDFVSQAAYLNELARVAQIRLTLLNTTGKVLFESDASSIKNHNYLERIEVKLALRDGKGSSIRQSQSLNKEFIYAAIVLKSPEQGDLVIRCAYPAQSVQQLVREVRPELFMAAVLIIILTLIIAIVVSRRITRPLKIIRKGAERFASGDLSQPIADLKWKEMQIVSSSLNKMAMELDNRLATVIRQKSEIETVLSSMIEGVVAVERGGKILRYNQAFRQMFYLEPGAERKILPFLLPNQGVEELIKEILKSREPVSRDMEFVVKAKYQVFEVTGTRLLDENGTVDGVLLVFNDVTRLRRLEKVRRDFVANVSHELRTPITSIRGFVETLLAGAIDDKKDATRFLQIIERQSDRLRSIIDDLLSLARIEQEEGATNIEMSEIKVKDLVGLSLERCQLMADPKKIQLINQAESEKLIRGDIGLLEQALVNLLGNAVKYSSEGTQITLRNMELNGMIRIEVEDQGCGIEAEHLPHLFERFYRVDKARSRDVGGTGLGLAIVKHIALLHEGHVEVKSILGKGSIFSLVLPEYIEQPGPPSPFKH
jgi:two-component system phosphate regulon sensor histidine kinase PhoR